MRAVRARRYEEVIDTQGLLRSALMVRKARGRRHGYDRDSIREPLACGFYDVRHAVSRDMHAIRRNQTLTGLALGYTPDAAIDYGLPREKFGRPGRYGLLLHATARPEKLWPQDSWIALANALQRLTLPLGPQTPSPQPSPQPKSGLPDFGHLFTLRKSDKSDFRWGEGADRVRSADYGLLHQPSSQMEPGSSLRLVLPWGTPAERQRGESIACAVTGAELPDHLPIDAMARLVAGASFVIGVDTGLVHLAAAFGVPLVAIFVSTRPGLTGPMGQGPIVVVGGEGSPPSVGEVLDAFERVVGG